MPTVCYQLGLIFFWQEYSFIDNLEKVKNKITWKKLRFQSSGMWLVNIYQFIQHKIQEDLNVQQPRCDIIKTHTKQEICKRLLHLKSFSLFNFYIEQFPFVRNNVTLISLLWSQVWKNFITEPSFSFLGSFLEMLY